MVKKSDIDLDAPFRRAVALDAHKQMEIFPRFKSAYSDKEPCVVDFTGEVSLTKQSFRDECDVNNIMARFEATGNISHLAMGTPRYGDFSDCLDYQTSLNRLQEAQESFMALPAPLRARFQNDPGRLLDFLNDPQNRSEAVSLGLIDSSPEVSSSPGGEAALLPEAKAAQ